MELKPLEELIDNDEPGWQYVEQWMAEAVNNVEVLEKDKEKAKETLYYAQVTTRSPMGAVIYESGGILVDDGWIRLLGSGSDKLTRDMISWNKGKSFEELGQPMPFVIIADDAVGGFYAINGGAFGQEGLGQVFYFDPALAEWYTLGGGYSEFVYWIFTGDLEEFYGDVRWDGWRNDVKAMDSDEVMSFYPFLSTEYEDINELTRKPVPIQEAWDFYFKK